MRTTKSTRAIPLLLAALASAAACSAITGLDDFELDAFSSSGGATSSATTSGAGGAGGTGGETSSSTGPGSGGSGGAGSGGSGGEGPTSACGGPWAHRLAQASVGTPSSLAVDPQGNIIEATGFLGTPDPALGTLNYDGGTDVLLVKRDQEGAVLWAQGFGATAGLDVADAVAVGPTGYIYMTGQVSAGADFGDGPPNIDEPAGFVATFDTNGNYVFDLQMTNTHGHAVAVVSTGMIMAGHSTSMNIETEFGNINVPYGGGLSDAFVARVTQSSAWYESYGDNKQQRALGVAVQSNSDVIVVGEFEGNIDFGNGQGEGATDEFDGFVAKLNFNNGNGMASIAVKGDTNQSIRAVAVDSADNVIIAGTIQQAIDFEGVQLPGNSTQDILLAKLGPNLEVGQDSNRWVKRFGGDTSAHATAVHVDDAGTIFLAGYFEGSLDFGDGVTVAGLGNSNAAFVAAFDDAGKALFARSFPVNGQDVRATGIAADACHNILVSGTYDGTLSFGGPALPNEGGIDSFVARIIPSPPLP